MYQLIKFWVRGKLRPVDLEYRLNLWTSVSSSVLRFCYQFWVFKFGALYKNTLFLSFYLTSYLLLKLLIKILFFFVNI